MQDHDNPLKPRRRLSGLTLLIGGEKKGKRGVVEHWRSGSTCMGETTLTSCSASRKKRKEKGKYPVISRPARKEEISTIVSNYLLKKKGEET